MADIVEVVIGNVLRAIDSGTTTITQSVGAESVPISIVGSGANQVISAATAPRYLIGSIGVIGDSQGTGNYQSAGNGFVDLMRDAFSDATITNYCVVNYNSRKLMPDGDNPYVDTTKNITKALSDGNTLIVVCDTSNDSDSTNPAGGLVPLSEWQSNLLTIQEAAITAGARILFISPFPRQQLSGSGQQQQKDMAAFMLRTFQGDTIYAYNILANPDNDLQLRPSYNYGDNIHLNDAGAAALAQAIISQLNQQFVTAPALRSSIQFQSASSANGTWSDAGSVTDNTENSLTVEKDILFYRARIIFATDYISLWSSIVQGLGSDTNNSPVVSAGSNKTVTLPTDSTTLTGTATDSDGTIDSLEWTQLSGPSAATIVTPDQLSTDVTDLVEGSYVFQLEAIDDLGASGSDTATVLVQEAGEMQTAGFKFAAGDVTPTTIAGYTDVTGGGLNATNYNRTWTHTGSGITLRHLATDSVSAEAKWGASFFNNNAGDDNGATVDDGGGFLPTAGAQTAAWFNSGASSPGNQFQLAGGTPAGIFTVRVYGSLKASFGLDADPMAVGFNALTVQQFNAIDATSRYAEFTGIVADESGIIGSFYVAPVSGQSAFGMLNALQVIQTA